MLDNIWLKLTIALGGLYLLCLIVLLVGRRRCYPCADSMKYSDVVAREEKVTRDGSAIEAHRLRLTPFGRFALSGGVYACASVNRQVFAPSDYQRKVFDEHRAEREQANRDLYE